MYPPKFDYYRAGSVDEAVSLLGQHDGAKLLAGGHSLLPAMNLRLADPGVLIDIGRIADLKGVRKQGDGSVHIGALTTHAMIEASADVPSIMSEAASQIGDPQVRNRGTIGGNVAHADPASDWPTILLAAKMSNPASRYAMVGAAAVLGMSDGTCTSASVAVGGLVPAATKAPSVEAALVGKALNADNIKAAAAAVTNDLGDDLIGDMHASADYRRAMAAVYVARALMKAAQG